MQVITDIHLYHNLQAICSISDEGLVLPDKELYRLLSLESDISVIHNDINEDHKGKRLRFIASAYFLKPFLKECLNSDVYRANVVMHLNRLSGYPENGVVFLKLILEPPDQEIIDYAWNERMLKLLWTRVEIENAFSWLSTLGGAYSALGDYFDHCAEEAGRISIRQYKLSKMLGDDGLAARSQLYSALSFSQRGNLKLSRRIVRNVAEFGRVTHDKRLVRMCQGVWAKLKYLRSLRNTVSQQGKERNGGNGKVINCH
ncbi:uncharacterized protein F58A4.6 [Galleria mellonella]|uniref:Uncharacterized protein F58A4.6 n=1 Tax=Galleria mellonella TaxID=7137 RepID=A0A6J1WK34_GALME|nr:uncharacterized protein F58A4.6 [Galleria mellonella]